MGPEPKVSPRARRADEHNPIIATFGLQQIEAFLISDAPPVDTLLCPPTNQVIHINRKALWDDHPFDKDGG